MGMGTSGGEAQGSLGRQKWALGIGGRKQNGDGMGGEGRGGAQRPRRSLLPTQTLSLSLSHRGGGGGGGGGSSTSLHFPLTASSSAPASASSIARGGSAACVCICSILLVDGMLWSMLWDGMGEKSIECRGEEESKRRSKSAPGPRARDPDRG